MKDQPSVQAGIDVALEEGPDMGAREFGMSSIF